MNQEIVGGLLIWGVVSVVALWKAEKPDVPRVLEILMSVWKPWTARRRELPGPSRDYARESREVFADDPGDRSHGPEADNGPTSPGP